MADYESREQEQQVKAWLKENGGAIVMGLVLAFGGLFGFKQWQGWQERTAQRASEEYAVMSDQLADNNLDAAVANYETLQQEFSDSPYAALAALNMARARIESDQAELAVAPLEFAMQNGRPDTIQLAARGRLARLQLDLGDPDAAIRTLDGAADSAGFGALFADIRGDALLAKGDEAGARAQYEVALEQMPAGTGDLDYLQVKLQTLTADDLADAMQGTPADDGTTDVEGGS